MISICADPPNPAAQAAPTAETRVGHWRAVAWAGALIFITIAYYESAKPHANALSQFALTCAVAEEGKLTIDKYLEIMPTSDKAWFGGHTYSDKSPVTAFLGVPAFLLYRLTVKTFHGEFSYDQARYWTTLLTVGSSAALTVMMLVILLLRRGVAPLRAALAGTLWVAATPLLGYSIHFYGYLPACAMTLGGFLLLERTWWSGARASAGRLLAAGFLLGLAAWTLNTFAIVALTLTPLVVFGPIVGGARGRRREWARRLWPWALGGALGAAGYFIYTHAIFGSFDSPYKYEVDPFFRKYMSRGLLGATWPNWRVAWLITFHPFQGLFLWFPLVTMALGGIFWRFFDRPARHEQFEGAVALAVLIALVTYTSAYYMWWGGYAYAPRHLIPALPLLAVGLTAWLTSPRLRAIKVLFVVGLTSAMLNAAAIAVDAQPPPGLPELVLLNPHQVTHWPCPYIFLQRLYWLENIADENWGVDLGLYGRLSLAPLVGIWYGALKWLTSRDGPLHQKKPPASIS